MPYVCWPRAGAGLVGVAFTTVPPKKVCSHFVVFGNWPPE